MWFEVRAPHPPTPYPSPLCSHYPSPSAPCFPNKTSNTRLTGRPSPQAIHLLRINQTFSRIVGAIWDIFFEIVAICFLVLVLVVAFATCLCVAMGRSDPLFASFGTSGARHRMDGDVRACCLDGCESPFMLYRGMLVA